MKIFHTRISLFVVIVFSFFVFIPDVFVDAWTSATQLPPNANISAPINNSYWAQSKIGGLLLNTGGAANGLIVQFGRVGLGVIIPSALFHVSDNTSTTDIFKITAGTNTVVVNQSGKVGIATSTPSQALDVEGNVRAARLHTNFICNNMGLSCLDFATIYNYVH